MLLTKILFNFNAHYMETLRNNFDKVIGESEEDCPLGQVVLCSLLVLGALGLNMTAMPIAMLPSLTVDLYKKITKENYKDFTTHCYNLSVFVRENDYEGYNEYLKNMREN